MTAPDKLFRDQLESMQKTPPPGAWDRVASGVQKQKRNRRILRISSIGLFLVLVSTTLIWFNTRSVTPLLQQEQVVPEPSQPVIALTPSPDVQNESVPKALVIEQPVIQSASKKVIAPTSAKTIIKNTYTTSPSVTELKFNSGESQTLVIDDIKTELPVAAETNNTLAESAKAVAASTKIVYSADEVNLRFKRNAVVKTDTVTKPSSGLQKVVALAYGFKNDNTMLGDLRQMKNDLFSIPGKKSSRVQ